MLAPSDQLAHSDFANRRSFRPTLPPFSLSAGLQPLAGPDIRRTILDSVDIMRDAERDPTALPRAIALVEGAAAHGSAIVTLRLLDLQQQLPEFSIDREHALFMAQHSTLPQLLQAPLTADHLVLQAEPKLAHQVARRTGLTAYQFLTTDYIGLGVDLLELAARLGLEHHLLDNAAALLNDDTARLNDRPAFASRGNCYQSSPAWARALDS